MKNTVKRIYNAPEAQMTVINSKDVITWSRLAFFGEDDKLTKEDVILEEVNNVDLYSYNVPCEE